MKISTWIRNYTVSHREPDQNNCPDMEISWTCKEGKKLYNPKTGIIRIESRYSRNGHYGEMPVYSTKSYGITGCYVKILKGGEILETSFVMLNNMKRGKDGEIREWTYYKPYGYESRTFLVKATGEVYKADGEIFNPEGYGKYYNKDYVALLNELQHAKYIASSNIYSELDSFTDHNSNDNYDHMYFWKFIEYYKNLRPREIKKNAVLDYEFEEPTNQQAVIFEVTPDGNYAVFRIIYGRDETHRVFVDKRGKVVVLADKYGKWAVSPVTKIHAYCYGNERKPVLDVNKLREFEGLKYIADIAMNTERDVYVVNNIIALLRHPIVEMLAKAGYPKVARYVTMNGNIKANIKEVFGVDLKKEKGSLTKLLDINKYILEALEEQLNRDEYLYRTYIPIGLMRWFFEDKFKGLTEDDTKRYYKIFKTIERKHGNFNFWFIPDADYDRRWSWNDRREAIPTEYRDHVEKVIKKLSKICTTEATEMYMDAIATWKQLNEKPDIDWCDFKTQDDVVRLHDNIVGLYNLQAEMGRAERERINREKFEKLQKKRIEKYEDVSSDDTFIIKVPRSTTEITSEGQMLRHCVGGYTNSYAQGYTNIVFLRRKDMPNTPFYTIEVTNTGYVVQIHGKCNQWLGNNTEAIAFVYKWITERGFACEEYKLLNTGAGYGRGLEEVDRSYLFA